jgi:hypothetical protein
MLAYVLVMATGCVAPYNKEAPPAITPAGYKLRLDPRFGDDLSKNWNDTFVFCGAMRARMVTESDNINTKNWGIGAAFAGLTAGLSLASGIYSILEGDQADGKVTAILALGAGVSTVPTFFYFGSDKRQTTVTTRIQNLDTKRAAAETAFNNLYSADRANTVVQNDGSATPAAKADAQTKLLAAEDALTAALLDYSDSCN